ncbi:Uncharacterised protein [Corynebacterium diphtheriae]|nr:Uncharacterised protein [Corynebacterium diphtheriae]
MVGATGVALSDKVCDTFLCPSARPQIATCGNRAAHFLRVQKFVTDGRMAYKSAPDKIREHFEKN